MSLGFANCLGFPSGSYTGPRPKRPVAESPELRAPLRGWSRVPETPAGDTGASRWERRGGPGAQPHCHLDPHRGPHSSLGSRSGHRFSDSIPEPNLAPRCPPHLTRPENKKTKNMHQPASFSASTSTRAWKKTRKKGKQAPGRAVLAPASPPRPTTTSPPATPRGWPRPGRGARPGPVPGPPAPRAPYR